MRSVVTTVAPQISKLPSLARSVQRVVALAGIAGYVEVIGFSDVGGIYPAIMTGNTVQLGLTVVRAQWARCGLLAFAVGLFFLGGIISSLIRRHLRRPPVELMLMAAVLVIAGVIRLHVSWRIPVELPLLALALAMQGETIARFGGVSLQTIVVTNNMVKFSDALVGRYLSGQSAPKSDEKRPDLKEVVLPGLAWLSYSVGAGAGAMASAWMRLPLIVPAVILVFLAGDLLRANSVGSESAG
ncbi:YoaK family protein [Granulicella sp. L60]|uniref:YoaK family protein n=1 Tax=Granulicella sp. L60 TaxID=1641866 RepID=UPI00131DD4E3|nr:YoaK family protein [Granulicella sp. L60]